MGRIDGKVVIVTGGTQGVGEATAVLAAERGAAGVVICGRNVEAGAGVADAIKNAGADSHFVKCDLSNVDNCRAVVRECDEKFGRIDCLVNAAADTNRGTLEDTTVEFWDHQFAVNVRGPFFLIQEAIKVMRREKTAGAIVNVLSVSKYCGMPNLVSYSATKGALSTLTKNIANCVRHDRIRVNGINLGWTDTPGEHVVQAKQGSPDNWLETGEATSPFGRLIKPLDVARLTLYLLSDESGILTGSNMDYTQRVVGFFPPETGR